MRNIKEVILDRVIEEVKAQIANSEQGLQSAMHDAKSHKGAMASRYDTFKEEAQYLASGHAIQISELNKHLSSLIILRGNMATLTKVSVYALVEVEDHDNNSLIHYFFLPVGGGESYEVNDKIVEVISVGSPIGRAFLGKKIGDGVVVRLPTATKHFSIISIT